MKLRYGFLTAIVVIGALVATLMYLGPFAGQLTRHSATWLASPGAIVVFLLGFYVAVHPDTRGQAVKDGAKVCLLAVVEYMACWSALVTLARQM